MKINISKESKMELLKAIKRGELDTDLIPELKPYEPARILSMKEAKEYISSLMNDK